MIYEKANKENDMSSLPKSGVIVYSENINSLSQFYMAMFDLELLRKTDDFISIGSNEFNIVIHTPPIEIPTLKFNAVKIFLTVESHKKARDRAVALGGTAMEGEWSNPLFKVCNIADPEGNHIQLREFRR
jgi:predicted enzyme related to lactoylglutathione lyase